MTGGGLQTTTAETLVAGDRETVFAAVSDLLEELWPARTAVVLSEPPCELVHTVRVDPDSEEAAAWLTWELTPSPSGSWTKVRLVHDEADVSSGPPPELDAVLERLAVGLSGSARLELR